MTGWKKGEALQASVDMMASWLSARGGQQSYEKTALVARVRLFLEEHGVSRFQDGLEEQQFGHYDGDDYPNSTLTKVEQSDRRTIYRRAGFRKGEFFCVLPEVFKAEIIKDFDADWVTRTLIAEKILIASKDKTNKEHPYSSVKPKGSQKAQRVYRIANILNDEAESQ